MPLSDVYSAERDMATGVDFRRLMNARLLQSLINVGFDHHSCQEKGKNPYKVGGGNKASFSTVEQ